MDAAMKRPTLAFSLSKEASDEAQTHAAVTAQGTAGTAHLWLQRAASIWITPTRLLHIQRSGLIYFMQLPYVRWSKRRMENILLRLQGPRGGNQQQADSCQNRHVHHNTPIKLNIIRKKMTHKGPLVYCISEQVTQYSLSSHS